jgi:hypothetical protein
VVGNERLAVRPREVIDVGAAGLLVGWPVLTLAKSGAVPTRLALAAEYQRRFVRRRVALQVEQCRASSIAGVVSTSDTAVFSEVGLETEAKFKHDISRTSLLARSLPLFRRSSHLTLAFLRKATKNARPLF